MTGPLLVAIDGAIATVTFDRPAKLNALSLDLLRSIVALPATLNAAEDVKVVVVRGAGRAFSAGFDLAEFARSNERGASGATSTEASPHDDSAELGRRAADALEALRAVTIAALHGHCVGGGVVLASACDLRIAAHDTRFAIPEIDLGIPLAWGGIPRLVRELGPARTRELVMTGAPFTAAEALAWGFVNRVVGAEELDGALADLCGSLVAKPVGALRATKQQVRIAAESMASTRHSDADAVLLAAAMHDPQARAAARAYLGRQR